MDMYEKLAILAEAAKYDASCSSSGSGRSSSEGMIGAATPAGCCHSFTADGRCVSLLKILMSNACVYDCKYCISRRSNDFPRATFTPREIAELTIEFYRRNYIEYISSTMLTDAPSEFSEALVPEAPVAPRKTMNVVLGFILGAFLVCAVTVVRFLLDDKIKTPDDIRRYTGLPTLAVVPDDEEAAMASLKKDSWRN